MLESIEKLARSGHPPGNLHEYQRKRLRKFSIRKLLILKGVFLVSQRDKCAQEKKKSGSKFPHSIRSYLQDKLYQRLRICQV